MWKPDDWLCISARLQPGRNTQAAGGFSHWDLGESAGAEAQTFLPILRHG